MRHIPFMKALSEVTDTSDPIWRDASAGYLVLRFFDRWLDDGPALMSFDQTLPALQARLESGVDVSPQVQSILLSAVQTMIDAPGTDPALVTGPLLAYAKYLELAGRLELAEHVYETILEALDSPSGCANPLLAASVFKQYGIVARLSGHFDVSCNAYRRAIILAEQANAIELAMGSRVGMASTLAAWGNLPDAETLLDQVIVDTASPDLVKARSWALHARGVTRTSRARFVDAMKDLFAAHELTEDLDARELILGDIAACAGAAGYRMMARDAYRVLAYTGRTPTVRATGLVNLLEIAVYDGDLHEFERVKRHLGMHKRKYALPAEHAMHAALYTAYSAERFGTRDNAITAYREVIAQSHNLGVHQIEFKAEASLSSFLAGRAATVTPPVHEPPDSLRSLVEVIAEWGALAFHNP